MKRIFLLFMFTIVMPLAATTYLPIDIEQQLKESSGVVHAKHLAKDYKKDSKGNVVTEYSFQVIKSAGIRSSEILNKNDFSIIVPGGKWQDIVYHVHGAPSFSIGEEVVLLVKRGGDGFRLTNLALGKYNIIRDLGGTYISSSVFPAHKKLSRIELAQFNQMVYENSGERFEEVYRDTYVYKPGEVNQKRSPASISEQEDNKSENDFSVFWLILCLSILGVYSMVIFRGHSENDQ